MEADSLYEHPEDGGQVPEHQAGQHHPAHPRLQVGGFIKQVAESFYETDLGVSSIAPRWDVAGSRDCKSPDPCTRPRTVLHHPQVVVAGSRNCAHLFVVPDLGLSSTIPWMDVGLEIEVVTHMFLVPDLGLSSTVPRMDIGLEIEVVL